MARLTDITSHLISAFVRSRQVEVGPSSFQKVKLLGKGDVGKVYLVREKKTDKLFAMKGAFSAHSRCQRPRSHNGRRS